MIRVVFSAVFLAMVFTVQAESFSEKLKAKFQNSIEKLPIAEHLKKEMLNSEKFQQMLNSLNAADNLSIPDSVKEELLNAIDYKNGVNFNLEELMKKISLSGFPETTTAAVQGEIIPVLNLSTSELERPFPTNISSEIIVGGENARLDDLTDRVENLEESVQELKDDQDDEDNEESGSTPVEPVTVGERTNVLTTASPVCPKDFVHVNGNCYMFSIYRKSWKDAKEACANLGAGLFSIETEAEYNVIINFLYLSFEIFMPEDYYTSGNDIEEQFKFIWNSTGQPVTFSAWAPEEPNNQYGDERCLEIKYFLEYEQYYWNDLPCRCEKYYICEMPK